MQVEFQYAYVGDLGEEKMTEELLLNSFVVSQEWDEKLQQLVQEICLLK